MLSQITPGPRTTSKNGYSGYLRTVPDRLSSDFTGAGTILTTIRCVEEFTPNSPGVFIKQAACKQPVHDPEGRIFKRPRRGTNGAPRDYFCRFS